MGVNSLSFRARILLFYFIFGFLPMLIISYFSFTAASGSISRITEKQLTELVQRISQQTESSYEKTRGDILELSNNPLIQLSFLQFSYGQRMEAVYSKLNVYRANSDLFSGISLYTPDGQAVMSVPPDREPEHLKTTVLDGFQDDFTVKQQFGRDKILMMKRVYDFEDETVPVGLLVFDIPLNVFTEFVDSADLGEGIHKRITSGEGAVVYDNGEVFENYEKEIKVYRTEILPLDWQVSIEIPERVLFKDIYALREKSILFAMIIAAIALGAALMFVGRILTPVRSILEGIRRFSKGDMDYRIKLRTGKEMRMLADAFDQMAEDLQKRQNELMQANKLASLGLMSAGIAHEIKNPLAGIKTSIQVLLKRIRTESNVSLATGVLEEVDRLNKIVGDLLNFSKPGPSNRIEYPLKKITDNCIQLMNKDLKDKEVTLYDEVEEINVNVDPSQTHQIIVNLLLNALAAVERGKGKIWVKSCMDPETGRACLSIRDNGKGIPEDKLDRVFDPFFTLSSEGTGLGLSVVFTLLKQNEISYKLKSREGEGTEFRLLFKE
ncbi:sensor histidine kinase [Limisalsivibrio acetivorans]|uniref:sensor histidine kinase n=1 Tax=Limisalsivibrio acetivorans TaxID=1304888 RepID=UPI0003B6E1C4|nr:ATP-binding protein [Limisalsivibrio acetivorans]